MASYRTLELFVLFFKQRDTLLERLEKELLADTRPLRVLTVAFPKFLWKSMGQCEHTGVEDDNCPSTTKVDADKEWMSASLDTRPTHFTSLL